MQQQPNKMQPLNADAQEWFPANHRNNPNQSAHMNATNSNPPPAKFSAQDRLKKYRPEAQTPVQPSAQPAPGQKQVHLPVTSETNVSTDLRYLQGIIARLTVDPGHFEEVIDIFMQTLHSHLSHNEMMTQVCDFIFAHAIEEANFRYNAARLCVLVQEESQLFRQYLNELCIREVEKNRQKPGFTLFLAELFSQGNQSNWKMLYDAVNKLIILGGDENVKTACQTLKLAGHSMEAFNKHMMDDVIKSLDEQKPIVQRNINMLIESVMNLRTHKWGHSTSNLTSGSSSASSNLPNGYANTNNVSNENFYVPNEEELTEDERRFMENAMEDLDDPDELYDPEPEMDEEIQAAFREFIRMGK